MALSAAQVYALARSVGLPHNGAVTATAIAWAESGLNPNAIGDVSLEDATWGPSVGLWQVRSVKSQTGTGGTRDVNKLTEPTFNARSMFSISGGGASWAAWSTYTSGAYRRFLPSVQSAVGDGSKVPSVSSFGGLTTTRPPAPTNLGSSSSSSGSVQDTSLLGDIWNYSPLGMLSNLFGGAVDSVVQQAEAAGLTILLYATGLGLGVALIVVGAKRIAEPVVKKAEAAAPAIGALAA